jgi:hypothetical protein
MDVHDAGVYLYRFDATIPREMRTPLWGPLHAREIGLPGWEAQDGGETGFIYHKATRPRKVGALNATIIVANRARRATLSVVLAGYPSHVPIEQRQLEALSLVTEAELLLTRLAGSTVSFTRTLSATVVDQNNPQDELLEKRDAAPMPFMSPGSRKVRSMGAPDRRSARRRDPPAGSELWDVF